MKPFLSILSVCIFFIFFNSCKKNDSGNNTNNYTIVGKWKWSYSVGGVGGVTISPHPDSVVVLNMNSDQTFSLKVNDQEVMQGVYHQAITGNDTVIHYDKQPVASRMYLQTEERLMKVNKDDLVYFDNDLSDGFNHYFKRQ